MHRVVVPRPLLWLHNNVHHLSLEFVHMRAVALAGVLPPGSAFILKFYISLACSPLYDAFWDEQRNREHFVANSGSRAAVLGREAALQQRCREHFFMCLSHFDHTQLHKRKTSNFRISFVPIPARCVSHKEKFLVVSHKGTVFFPCGIFRKSKISH